MKNKFQGWVLKIAEVQEIVDLGPKEGPILKEKKMAGETPTLPMIKMEIDWSLTNIQRPKSIFPINRMPEEIYMQRKMP